ncbi:MAG: hypothetical protein J5666_05225 [Bacilli bacterium]|nr:hypothetical protein [Bacilli bacterium]
MVFKIISFLLLTVVTSTPFKTDIKKNADATTTDGKVIYVDVSLNDSLIDNDPYLQYVKGSTKTKYNLVLDDNNIYHTEANITFPKDGYYEIHNSTDYVSDKIDSVTLAKNNYNYVCASGDKAIQGYGYYTGRTSNPKGATYKTQRVWLNNDNTYFYGNDDWGSHCKNVIGYFNDENNWQMVTMPSVINTYDNRNYYYADIPYYVTSVHFLRMGETEHHNYLMYQDVEISRLTWGGCYFAGTSSYEDFLNTKTSYVDGADSTLLSMVLESYLTYGMDFSNGCASTTIRNLYSTWFEHKSATSADLKNTKIMDYTGYAANGNSYEGLEKTSSFSLNEKWNTMCSNAGIDPNTGKTRTINLSWLSGDNAKFFVIVGGVGFIFTLLAITYAILKKKLKHR